MGIKELLSGVGIVILFVIAMLYFMISFIQTNNPEGFNSGSDIAYLNSTLQDFNERAQALQAASENAKNLIEAEQPSAVYVFLIIVSAFTIPPSFLAFLISGAFAIVTITFTSLFGVGPSAFYIVFAVINGLLMIAIVLAILKAIRLGQTER